MFNPPEFGTLFRIEPIFCARSDYVDMLALTELAYMLAHVARVIFILNHRFNLRKQ
jgi:hypothetical protein